jgi:hypothetical protein|tara:strand:- start:1114 stop:1965 length:852 start_codon:yes stop_codon:yes gene_type:complete
MILVDFSGIAIANIAINKVNDEGMLRHMMINSLRMYRSKFKDQYGELVLAIDAGNNWRRNYYPQYKANRKKSRKESDFDWNEAFRILDLVQTEIRQNFPYKVIKIDECEADDVIGTIVANTQEFGQYEDVMIISSDHDFKQLQKFPNVKQFSPLLKKPVVEDNPRSNLVEKILTGDAGDGVPNVLSHDDVFVNGERQTPLSRKKKDAIIEDLAEGELLYAASWYRNYCRNKTLIDLTETPDRLKNKIISEFNSQDQWKNKGLVLPYLINNNMKMMIESIEELV